MNNLKQLIEQHKLWIETAGRKGDRLTLDGISITSNENLIIEQSFLSECFFEKVAFENTDFYQAELYSCKFNNTKFSNCDFRKVTCDYGKFENVEFVNCKFSKADFFQTIFINCKFNKCSFVGINLMESVLSNSELENIDFDSAYLDKVKVEETKFKTIINIDKASHLIIVTDKELDIEKSKQLLKELDI